MYFFSVYLGFIKQNIGGYFMNKLLWIALLSMAPLFAHASQTHEKCHCDAEYGYFYNDALQLVYFLEPILWAGDNSVHSEGIYIQNSDRSTILIEQPGVYEVIYSVNAVGFLQPVTMALFLNDDYFPIDGSVFTTTALSALNEGLEIGDIYIGGQIFGHVLFRIAEPSSTISLVNLSLNEENAILLDNQTFLDIIDSVSATLYIQKVGK